MRCVLRSLGVLSYFQERNTKVKRRLNLLAPDFFLILANPVYKNVNNIGTKYVRIMKPSAF
jgi:hypothetical protein